MLGFSLEARDLICRLLCDVELRLGSGGADQIKAHPWFRDVIWDKLYQIEASFKPEVMDELDTQNFLKFDEVGAISPQNMPAVGKKSSRRGGGLLLWISNCARSCGKQAR